MSDLLFGYAGLILLASRHAFWRLDYYGATFLEGSFQ